MIGNLSRLLLIHKLILKNVTLKNFTINIGVLARNPYQSRTTHYCVFILELE